MILETTGTANGSDSLRHYLAHVDQGGHRLPPLRSDAEQQLCLDACDVRSGWVGRLDDRDTSRGCTNASAGTTTGDGSASLVDAPAPTAPAGGSAPATGTPAGSGVLSYLLGGSGR